MINSILSRFFKKLDIFPVLTKIEEIEAIKALTPQNSIVLENFYINILTKPWKSSADKVLFIKFEDDFIVSSIKIFYLNNYEVLEIEEKTKYITE